MYWNRWKPLVYYFQLHLLIMLKPPMSAKRCPAAIFSRLSIILISYSYTHHVRPYIAQSQTVMSNVHI